MLIARALATLLAALLMAGMAMADTVDTVRFKAGGILYVWDGAGTATQVSQTAQAPPLLLGLALAHSG